MPSAAKLILACVVCLFVLATEAFSLQSLPSTSKVSVTQRNPAFISPSSSSSSTKTTPAVVTKPHRGDDFAMRMVSTTGISGGGNNKPVSPLSKLISTVWNDQTKIMFYVGIWYLGNIYYNIYNKKALNLLGNGRCHWTLAAVQLLVGVLFVIPMWLTGIRSKPELTLDNWKTLFPVGFFSAAAHGFSVLALGAGAVSFGQIVKAGEPVFAAATGAVLLKQIDHPIVYAALLPIIAGVGLASLKEMSFTWTALIAASGANQAAALKNVVSKKTMSEPWAKKLGPQNTYAVVTILALLSTLPVALFSDLTVLPTIYKEFSANGEMMNLIKYSIYSGLNFYIYNEFSFLALSKLSPVTHSVANTLKRVVIIVASCIVFNTPMNALGMAGSGIAILGTLLYSLAKKQYGGGGH